MVEVGSVCRESVVKVGVTHQSDQVEHSNVEESLTQKDFVELLGEVVSRRQMLVFEFVEKDEEGDNQREEIGHEIDVIVAYEGSGVELKHVALAIRQGNEHRLEMQASAVLERTQREQGQRQLLLLEGYQDKDNLDDDYLVEASELLPEHSDQGDHQARHSDQLGPSIYQLGFLQILV